MPDRGKYENITDAGVVIYLLYQVVRGTIYWQDPSEQCGAWVCLVLMILYLFIICAIDAEREMMNNLFKVEKLPWGYHVK